MNKKFKNHISDKERLSWLRLIRSENIGPKNLYDLLKIYKTPEKALEAIPEMSIKGGRRKPIKLCSTKIAEQELVKIEKFGAKLIAFPEADYPETLRHIYDPPPVITVLGNTQMLNQDIVGIVGARNASANACMFTARLASDLGKAGYIIASGLARGIDTSAHKASLSTGTIAVIAGGIDNIYPPENKSLYQQIGEKGAIISELPFGAVPRAQNFPQRNRIISGISIGVVITEAAVKSGSLITARLALEQGKEVFAVPGFPLDPRAGGTNKLIKNGASIVESAQDVINGLQLPGTNKNINQQDLLREKMTEEFLTAEVRLPDEAIMQDIRETVIEKLSQTPIFTDELVRECGIPLNHLLAVILELELAGRIERHPGNKISINYETKSLFEAAG